MKEYVFSDCEIGLSESFAVEITETMMTNFCTISGDENPMHMSSIYAQNHGYEDRLVYGMLTSSFFSRLVGMYLPGRYCILKTVEVFFERPVYIGDVLTVSGRVKEKDERFRQMIIKGTIKNQEGKTVSKANILVGFYE